MTWTLGQQIWNGFITGVAYSVFAMGLTLIFGVMRVINMAHGELYMLGGMFLFTFAVYFKLPFLAAMLASAVAVGFLGLIFNRLAIQPLLKAQPLSIMMSTMAVSVILLNLATVVWNVDTRVIPKPVSGAFRIAGMVLDKGDVVLSAVGLAALVCLHLFLTRTVLGSMMRATAQDHIGAALVGINVKRIYGLTVAVSSALAAVAGGIIGPIWAAYPGMGQDILIKGFAVVIVGGMGNIRGCVITGLLLGITEALFSQYVSSFYRDVYAFGLLVLVCLIRPQGLFARA